MEAAQTMAALPSSQWRWEVAFSTLTWQMEVDLLGTVSIDTALILDIEPKRSAWESPRGPVTVLAMQ